MYYDVINVVSIIINYNQLSYFIESHQCSGSKIAKLLIKTPLGCLRCWHIGHSLVLIMRGPLI